MKKCKVRRVPVAMILLGTLGLLGTPAFASSPSAAHKRSKLDRDLNAIGHRDIAYKGNWYSGEKEKQIGSMFSAAFERSAPLLHDEAIDAYLVHLTEKIAQNSDAKIPVTVRVVNSDDVYAITLPGGYQYLTRGLLLTVDDEAGLASVLARGIAHTALGSATMDMTRSNLMQLITIPLISQGSPPPIKGQVSLSR